MYRIRRSVVILLSMVMVVALGMVQSAQAHPSAIQCGPYVQPGICSPALHLDDVVVIRSGIPFVWLREKPSSSSPVITTVFGWTNTLLRVNATSFAWDGYQSWYFVIMVSRPSIGGWVEQASLKNVVEAMPTQSPPTPNSPNKPNWPVPMIASLKSSLSFGWIRSSPSSYATYLATIYPQTTFTVLGVPNPVYDGVQWWWYVQFGTFAGWLEQNSITPIRTSATPIVIYPSATPTVVNPPVIRTPAAFQTFENGYMIWTGFDQQIYVFNGKNGGMFVGVYPISSYEGLPDNPITEPAPNGLVKPISGFGRVWGNFSWIRQPLGWAIQPEQGYTATFINNGLSKEITLPDGRTIHILRGSWNF